MKITTKQLAQTALLLALCILSQFFKNLSVYFTGPIINTILLIATIGIGLQSGLILAVITPITSFFITGSPILAAIPLMFPVIMFGNIILVFVTHIFATRFDFKQHLAVGMVSGAVLKAIFMGTLSVFVVIPLFGSNLAKRIPDPAKMQGALNLAKVTFSVTQLITALLGAVLALIIWIPLKRYLKKEQE